MGETHDTAKLGVQLLLQRMQSHPEEFDVANNSKWLWFVDALVGTLYTPTDALTYPLHRQLRFISREDLEMLYAELSKMQGSAFTDRVVLGLYGVEHPDLMTVPQVKKAP